MITKVITAIKFCGIGHRCLFTSVNVNTGEKNPEGEPLKTLKTFRLNFYQFDASSQPLVYLVGKCVTSVNYSASVDKQSNFKSVCLLSRRAFIRLVTAAIT